MNYLINYKKPKKTYKKTAIAVGGWLLFLDLLLMIYTKNVILILFILFCILVYIHAFYEWRVLN